MNGWTDRWIDDGLLKYYALKKDTHTHEKDWAWKLAEHEKFKKKKVQAF